MLRPCPRVAFLFRFPNVKDVGTKNEIWFSFISLKYEIRLSLPRKTFTIFFYIPTAEWKFCRSYDFI